MIKTTGFLKTKFDSTLKTRPNTQSSSFRSTKSMKFLNNTSPIEIVPQEVVFTNIQPNQIYQMCVFVRNLSKIPRRIRIVQPITSKFRCDYDMQAGIAAGLAMNLVVIFETDTKGDFHDIIKLFSDENYEFELLVHAYQPRCHIIFDNLVNMGFCKINKTKESCVKIINQGDIQGKIELKLDPYCSKDIKIEPSVFILGNNRVQEVVISYTPKDNGILRVFVEVYIDGNNLQKNIEVTGTSVEYNKLLVDENGTKIDSIDFGATYFGQKKEIRAILVNNTPEKTRFKVKFRNGILSEITETISLQTPNEVGHEQIEKVVSCLPEEGIIDSYSQIPLKFCCKSKVDDQKEFRVLRNAQIPENNDQLPEEAFSYSAFIEYNGQKEDNSVIFINGRGICPQIKLSQTSLDFYECPMHEKRDILIKIENRNEEVPIDYFFEKIPFFFTNPSQSVLLPNQSSTFTISFQPKSLGEYTETLILFLMNGSYRIPLKVHGTSSIISRKPAKIRGPEGLQSDFNEEKNFIHEENTNNQLVIKRRKGEKRLIFSSQESFKPGNPLFSLVDSNTGEQFLRTFTNKSKYNHFLQEQRQSRQAQRQTAELQHKMKEFEAKNKEIKENLQVAIPANTKKKRADGTIEDDESLLEVAPQKSQPPLDFKFLIGYNSKEKLPKLELPMKTDPLFVTKPIEKYEPVIEMQSQLFNPDPLQRIKKKFPAEPKSHAEIRDCAQELTGPMLQKIYAGPVEIDFKAIYVKSQEIRTFFVRNDLRNSILVRLVVENEELQASFQNAQVIPCSQTAGFEIVFLSKILQEFKGFVKYIINERHVFEFRVVAKVNPVKLDLSANYMDFKFEDNNLELQISQVLHISNKGNSPGKFQWMTAENKIFSIRPQQGEVPAQGSTDVYITYKPSGNSGNRSEEEKLRMKVEDGLEEVIRCEGFVKEAKCIFKQEYLDLGIIPICKKEDSNYLYLKNIYKNPAVYHVALDKLPPYTEVFPLKDKLLPDETKFLKVSFCCKEEKKIDTDIVLWIRGGKPVAIPFRVETIIPKVSILEDEFDFGGVTTLGNSGVLRMTVLNSSNIPATLILDLREKENPSKECEGVECLDIIPYKENGGSEGDDSSILLSVNEKDLEEKSEFLGEIKLGKDLNNLEEIIEKNSVDSEENEENEKITSRHYKFTVHPQSPLIFNLKFSPKDVRNYSLELPLTLMGYGRLDSLIRTVTCKGLKPKFLLQPQPIDFKKKVIVSKDKCVPSVIEVTISNPDNRAVSWRIDLAKFENDKVFSFVPNEGRLDGLQTTIIKACFNPVEPQYFERIAYLFVESEPNKPYLEILLKGLGAHPKLNFDRREIVLPIVPLGISSKCIFRIFNDGYENMALKELVHQEMENLNLKVNFLDGKTLGVTKNRMKVEVSFLHNKPVSFTTKIDFIDENSKIYSIPVSGTTDNSLFTNFPYFQRHFDNEYTVQAEEGKPLNLQEVSINSDDEDFKTPRPTQGGGMTKSNHRAASVVSMTKSSRSVLGFEPISRNMLEKSCEILLRWLNHTALNLNIQSFPGDLIQNNGIHLFELLNFLTGKTLSFKAKIDLKWKRSEKVSALIKQYSELIRFLKEDGALLNTIRPQYLLNYLDFNAYLKSQNHENLINSAIKISEHRFSYISLDSWITLVYQILKIYYLSRINVKNFKALPGIPAEKLITNDNMIEGSNFMSSHECLLLRWLEIAIEIIYPAYCKRLVNFGNDFKNCLGVAAVIQLYAGINTCKNLKTLKIVCQNEDDVRYNADKIIAAMNEIRLQTHCISKDFYYPSQREIILFLMNLWFNLPHYLPKGTEVFKCVLGEEVIKDIELKNTASNKVLAYWVKIEGSPDFTIERDEVKLDPKIGVYKFKVKFFARLSKPQHARITFTNKKEGNTQAGTLVFDLVSEITQRKSVQDPHYIQSKLYKLEEFKLSVKNHFVNSTREFAEFQITLIHEPMNLKKPEVKDNGPRNIMKKKPDITENKEEEAYVIPAFFVLKDKIKIRKGDSGICYVQFLPFKLETHKCHIVFCDPEVGELQHTIIGETLMPEPLQENIKPNFTVYIESNQKLNLPIDFRNDLLREARKIHEQRLAGRTKEKEFYLKQIQKETIEKENIVFEVDSFPESPNVSVPYSLTILDKTKAQKKIANNETAKEKDKETKKNHLISQGTMSNILNDISTKDTNSLNELSMNILPITFNFKAPYKDFAFSITLKNAARTDIRIYKFVVTVHPKIIKATLEMKVPMGEELKQEIPLINNTDKNWGLKISWPTAHDTNGQYFSGPKDFIVKAKTTGYYIITFRPLSIGKAEARLIITNTNTNEVFDYELLGFGEEPLALDHIILDCVARKQTTKLIEVPNPYKDRAVLYRVETDLINPDGPPSFKVPPGKTFKYPLTVTPSLGGLYTGSISFYEEGETNKYIWYTVLMNTDRPKAEKTFEMTTFVRKSLSFSIDLCNPLRESVVFEVVIEGEGLSGPATFSLLPLQTSTCEVFFLPLRAFKSKGSVVFIQEKLGEIWYELSLTAEENPVIRSPTLKAELGKVEEWVVYLENPSSFFCDIEYKISNPNNFDVFPEFISIEPYETIPVKIKYIPSDLDINETGEILFESDKIGKWQFLVFGMGLPPTKFEPKVINGALFKDLSSTITFKNPFKETINVIISIEHSNDLSKEALQLLIKKPKTSIVGLNILQIPFSFTPKEISEYHADIIVFMNEKIQWRYPIHAITESTSQGPGYRFRTKARVPLIENISVKLPGLPQEVKSQKFIYEVNNVDENYQNLVKKCLNITEIKGNLEYSDDELLYQVKFSPMKPFKTSFDLIISRRTGGRWKFRVFLEATDPDEDDTLVIYSALNSTKSVSFKLTNRYKSFASFNAFFTPDSDPEFSIMPKSGDLEPLGREGRTFVVSFTPIDYGKMKRAKLIIETEELLWSYIVKGELPVYKAPNAVESRIENKFKGEQEEKFRHEHKNFLNKNIKKINEIQNSAQKERKTPNVKLKKLI